MSRIVNDLRRLDQILGTQTTAVDACAAGHGFLGHNRGLVPVVKKPHLMASLIFSLVNREITVSRKCDGISDWRAMDGKRRVRASLHQKEKIVRQA